MKAHTVFSTSLILALFIVSCKQELAPIVTQSPTDMPTPVSPPTFAMVPSPTAVLPYPTASIVKANAIAFIAIDQQNNRSLWVANVDGSGERKLVDIEENTEWLSSRLLQWSPDGKWISYISGDELWIISPDSLVKRKNLSIQDIDNGIITNFKWSPDSSKIAYLQAAYWSENTPTTVELLDLATGATSEVSSPQLLGHTLAWSPDGRYLLFDKGSSFIIFEVGTQKIIKEISSNFDCGIGMYDGLEWSPNSKWFYHTHSTSMGEFSWICISGLDGSNQRIYINAKASVDSDPIKVKYSAFGGPPSIFSLPVWDKTGNYLYIAADKIPANPTSEPGLWRYDIRTQEAEQILKIIRGSTVSISPDKRILEMDSGISEKRQSYIFMNLDSLATTSFEISDGDTVWSADNQHLIFLSGSDSRFYRLDIQTGETTVFSGAHSVAHWVISPVATSP